MFYAMAENKIDLRGYRFEHRLEDIQTLNERALRGELHISAISIHAYAYVGEQIRAAARAARAWAMAMDRFSCENAEHPTSNIERQIRRTVEQLRVKT